MSMQFHINISRTADAHGFLLSSLQAIVTGQKHGFKVGHINYFSQNRGVNCQAFDTAQ